jgi:hypothetical protein
VNLKVQSVRFPEPEPCIVTLLQLQGSLLLQVIDAGACFNFFSLYLSSLGSKKKPIGFNYPLVFINI